MFSYDKMILSEARYAKGKEILTTTNAERGIPMDGINLMSLFPTGTNVTFSCSVAHITGDVDSV